MTIVKKKKERGRGEEGRGKGVGEGTRGRGKTHNQPSSVMAANSSSSYSPTLSEEDPL